MVSNIKHEIARSSPEQSKQDIKKQVQDKITKLCSYKFLKPGRHNDTEKMLVQ